MQVKSLKRTRCKLLISFFLCTFSLKIFAQQIKTISGFVKDSVTHLPLNGVSVLEQGTNHGTTTDPLGKFSFHPSNEHAILVFSYLGYIVKRISLNENMNLNQIYLAPDTKSLSDVVVIGYGSQNKKDLTGAVSEITSKEIADRPITRIEQAMQGHMAGVQVRATTGQPGAALQIRVRGSASVNGSNDPLYVVDGVPVTDLNDINPDDIASISVLKDAASTAIYGSRATNGVVLITTKAGQAGKTIFTFNTTYTTQSLAKKMDLLSGPEFIDLATQIEDSNYVKRGLQLGKTWSATDPISVREANLGSTARNSTYIPDSRWAYGTDSLSYVDWQDAFYQNAPMVNYELAASGGTGKITYRISGGYLGQNGIGAYTGYKRFSLRANFQAQLTSFLKLGLDLAPSYSMSNGGNVDGKDAQSHHVLSMVPVVEKDAGINSGVAPYGPYYWGGSTQSPIAYQKATTNNVNLQRLLSNLYLSADIMNGLNFKVTGGWNSSQENHKTYHPSIGLNQLPGSSSSGTYATANSQYYLFESILSYNRSFGKSRINAIVGYTAEETINANTSLSANKFANDDLTTISNATSTITAATQTELKRTLLSYLSRVQYSYDDKYLLSASFRRDGSSIFGANNKWGDFPSVGLGWNVANESFMKNISWLSQFKLRYSLGENGNNGIPDYLAYGGIASSNYSFNNSLINGYVPSSISNANLHWEKTRSGDFGLDFGIIKDRITGTVDYYNKKTTDMLLNVPFALSTGFASGYENIGNLSNKGWEFLLNTRNLIGKFQWETSLNFSVNQNKILALGNGNAPIHTGFSNLTQIDEVGKPIGEYYLYDAIGVYKDQNDLNNSPHMSTNKVGDVKYKDVNKDGVIDANDRTDMGQPDPKFNWGVYNTFSFKGFDLSFLIQGSGGNMVYNLIGRAIDRPGMGFSTNALGRWRNRWRSPTDPGDGYTPRIDGTTGGLYDSRWLYSGTYARFKNITIGYNLPHNLIKGIASARIYVSGENLFYIKNSDYGGYSPELENNVKGSNYDYGAYPDARSILVGINIGF